MNIFITGASGFIGSRLAKYFSNKNFVICNYNKRKLGLDCFPPKTLIKPLL